MMRKILPALLLFLALVTACSEKPEAAPTPFPPTPTPQAALRKNRPFPVKVQDLLRNPEMYQGALLQVTGRYEQRPLLACAGNEEMYPSPATWALADENGVALAAGEYDSSLRALRPEALTVTVAGYWEEWQGLVGCGQEAEQVSLWYLRVTDIISSSPLAQVTLTPAGETAGKDDLEGTAVTSPTPGGIPVVTPDTSLIVTPAAGTGAPTTTPTLNSGGSTPTPRDSAATTTPTPTSTPQTEMTPTTAVTPSPTATTPAPAESTATPTGQATATPANTPTGTPNPLATATSPPGNLTDVFVDDVYTEDVFFNFLASGEKQIWDLVLDDSTVITISVAAEPQMRLSFNIVDENEAVIATQDVSGGDIGTAAGITVDPAQFYTIEIFAPDSSVGNYAIVLWGNDPLATPNEAQGFLAYGQTASAALRADGDNHYWFFYGQAGELVDITTSSEPDRLLLLSLYDRQGNVVVDGNGDDVELIDQEALAVPLPETGLYAIWLIENDFSSSNYTIQLRRN